MAGHGWNGGKWLGKGLEMAGMDENGCKSPKKIENGWKRIEWLNMAGNGLKWLDGQEMAINGCKWQAMTGISWKLPE